MFCGNAGHIFVVDGLSVGDDGEIEVKKMGDPPIRCESFSINGNKWKPMQLQPDAPKITAVAVVRDWVFLAGLETQAKKDGRKKETTLLHCEYYRPSSGDYGRAKPLPNSPLKELSG